MYFGYSSPPRDDDDDGGGRPVSDSAGASVSYFIRSCRDNMMPSYLRVRDGGLSTRGPSSVFGKSAENTWGCTPTWTNSMGLRCILGDYMRLVQINRLCIVKLLDRG